MKTVTNHSVPSGKERGTFVKKDGLFDRGKLAMVAFLFFGAGFLVHLSYGRYLLASPPENTPTPYYGTMNRLTHSKFKFIQPLLSCDIVSDKRDVPEFQSLNELLRRQVETEINKKQARNVSVYFRGMNTGRWAGFQEEDSYAGGSLVKVPFLIAYYKFAEDHPEILDQTITYEGDFDESAGQKIPPAKKIEEGKAYAIADLLHRMIVYSGNNSTVLLMRRLDRTFLNDIFNDLNIPNDQDENRQWLITPKRFAYFFSTLYNGTYLSQTLSEQALDLLSQVDFKEGLVAGVPKLTEVAHKFGEHTKQFSDGTVLSASLHDCGIVYHSDHPYFLCIMTEGQSQESLKGVMARISQEV
jgi:beta-lactamase class A